MLSLTGCGSGLVPVSGTVTVDGQPTEGVQLFFQPLGNEADAIPATTMSGPDGKFSLTTNMEPGVRKGSYRVTAKWPDPNHKEVRVGFSDPEPAPDVFKGRYMGQSGVVTREITAATNDLLIELSKNP